MYIRSVLDAVAGPVVLVRHSSAGSVITQAAAGAGNVKALVLPQRPSRTRHYHSVAQTIGARSQKLVILRQFLRRIRGATNGIAALDTTPSDKKWNVFLDEARVLHPSR